MKKKKIIAIIAAAVLCAAGLGIWFAVKSSSGSQKHGDEETENMSFGDYSVSDEAENSRAIIEPESDSPGLDENELQEVPLDVQ